MTSQSQPLQILHQETIQPDHLLHSSGYCTETFHFLSENLEQAESAATVTGPGTCLCPESDGAVLVGSLDDPTRRRCSVFLGKTPCFLQCASTIGRCDCCISITSTRERIFSVCRWFTADRKKNFLIPRCAYC